ncbi:ADC synthase [Mycena albidolilacea]|uniref:aminodeoxychorismate synthase n=1 Tax=Mycena albidolilacea TaxID=1033008 RepID=A0AAD7EZG3_9AGAR|nr:ADC synthase [Mycena albidolilacea]
MAVDETPRLLLIDSYDSFTFNLAALCHRAIPGCLIHIIKNDLFEFKRLLPLLKFFSAVVVGPGPGSPEVAEDIGVVKHLWNADSENLIPIFGVCLGLQSLGIAFGGRLLRLNVVKHGQISTVHHSGTDLFWGIGTVQAVRYHSLHIQLDESLGCELEKLAWTSDLADNGEVIMGLKHKTRPFWAVQYHPESVCTNGGSDCVLRNFWILAQSWSAKHNRKVLPWNANALASLPPPWPASISASALPVSGPETDCLSTILASVHHLPHFQLPLACELLGAADEHSPFVFLDSAAEPGRFSIIGCINPMSVGITYYMGCPYVFVSSEGQKRQERLPSDIWAWLSDFMCSRKARGNADIPFWGGLVGYMSYEVGVDGLDIPLLPSMGHERYPDINLAFVERTVVFDHETGDVHIQSLRLDDSVWVSETGRLLLKACHSPASTTSLNGTSGTRHKAKPVLSLPQKDRYIAQIEKAKEFLLSGDSYELCLTARARITFPFQPPTEKSSSWTRYKHLRSVNPAPHAAYIRLHPTTFMSSSPERFISYSRPPNTLCQLRPIKGTVRKTAQITREIAEEMLIGSAKEVAENLMIVDLIRHDLHRVVGVDVKVTQFCGVEEYHTVYQLVSSIEGRPKDSSIQSSKTNLGWETLRTSLPPGSMTGAPKKRSVEILQSLEDDDRGIYSGIFGYWCVGGGGDWSVTIRSCFKHEDPCKTDIKSDEVWVLGAGGAITALSDPEAEWDEMNTKLQSVLKAFDV